jgi:hypothetical protein
VNGTLSESCLHDSVSSSLVGNGDVNE